MSRGVRYWLVSASKSCNVLPCVGVAMCIGASELSGSIAIIGIPRADTHCLAHSPNAAGMSLHFILIGPDTHCLAHSPNAAGVSLHFMHQNMIGSPLLNKNKRALTICSACLVLKYISLSYYRV